MKDSLYKVYQIYQDDPVLAIECLIDISNQPGWNRTMYGSGKLPIGSSTYGLDGINIYGNFDIVDVKSLRYRHFKFNYCVNTGINITWYDIRYDPKTFMHIPVSDLQFCELDERKILNDKWGNEDA